MDTIPFKSAFDYPVLTTSTSSNTIGHTNFEYFYLFLQILIALLSIGILIFLLYILCLYCGPKRRNKKTLLPVEEKEQKGSMQKDEQNSSGVTQPQQSQMLNNESKQLNINVNNFFFQKNMVKSNTFYI